MALRMPPLNLEEPSEKAFQVEAKKKKKDFLVVFYESDNTPWRSLEIPWSTENPELALTILRNWIVFGDRIFSSAQLTCEGERRWEAGEHFPAPRTFSLNPQEILPVFRRRPPAVEKLYWNFQRGKAKAAVSVKGPCRISKTYDRKLYYKGMRSLNMKVL